MTNDRRNRNTVLFLRPDELKGLIRMDEAIEAVDQGYREAAALITTSHIRPRSS
jgi:hypothetical protein